MDSPAATSFASRGCMRSWLTPGRKTPSGWRSVTSPLPIYTSTPLNDSPHRCHHASSSACLQLLEWEVSAVLSESKSNASPLAARSPVEGATLGCGGSLAANRTPTAAPSPLLRRRINRRILESSCSSSGGEGRSLSLRHPQSPVSQESASCSGSTVGSSRRGPVRHIQRQRAMVKKFMVTKKKLSKCKIMNDNRGGLRL